VELLLNGAGDFVKAEISLDIRKNCFPVRTVRLWSWLLREAPSMEVFKKVNWIKL